MNSLTVKAIDTQQLVRATEQQGLAMQQVVKVKKDWAKLRKAAGKKKALITLLDNPNTFTPLNWVVEFMAAAGHSKAKKALLTLFKVVKPDLVIQGLQEFPDLWKVFAYLDTPEVFNQVDLKPLIEEDKEESFWKAFYEVPVFPTKMAKYAWQWKHDVVIPSAWLTKPILRGWVNFSLHDLSMGAEETQELIQTVIINLPAPDKQQQLASDIYQETWREAVTNEDEKLINKLQAMKVPYEPGMWQRTPNPLGELLISGSQLKNLDLPLIKQLAKKKYLLSNLQQAWHHKWFTEVELNVPTLEAMRELGLDPWVTNQAGLRWIEWGIQGWLSDEAAQEGKPTEEETKTSQDDDKNGLKRHQQILLYLAKHYPEQLRPDTDTYQAINQAIQDNLYLGPTKIEWIFVNLDSNPATEQLVKKPQVPPVLAPTKNFKVN